MKDWRNYDPRSIPDDELLFDHAIVHSWWNNPKLRPEGCTEEDIKRLHDMIVREMERRGMKHDSPLKFADVNSFRNEPMGREVSLEEVLKYFKEPIVISRGFVTLVGGLPNRGKTDGDIDILIRWPENTPDEVVHPIRFRLGRALPAELSKRVQFLMDKYHGPFTSHVPLYDLVLVPAQQQLVAMSVDEIKGILDEKTRSIFLDHMDIQNIQVLIVPFAGTGLFIHDALKRNPNLVVYANDFASWSRVCLKSLLLGVEEDIEHVKEKYGLKGYPNYAVILALVKWFNEGKEGDLKQYAEYFAQKYKPLNAKNVHIFQMDAREFVKQVEGDIAFVNPPKMTRRGETLWKKFDELDSLIEGKPIAREHDLDLDQLLGDVIKNLRVKKVYVNTIRGGKPSVSRFSHQEIIKVGRDTLSLINKEDDTTPKVVLATICGKTKADIDYGYPHELWGEKEEVSELHKTGLPYAVISYRYGLAWWDTKYPYYDEWESEGLQPLIEKAKRAMRPGVQAMIVYLKSFPHGRKIVHELQKALPDVEFYVATDLKQALELYEKLTGDEVEDPRQQKLFELRDEEAEKEAKQSRDEDKIEPLRFFYPLKATLGYHEGEVYNLEQILSHFKYPEDYPVVCQKKYDGLRIIWMKKGDKVIARTDDGTRCDDRFPTLVKMLKELPIDAIVLDSEVEGWTKDGEHWGREITAGYARAHDQPADDANFVANVFDVLYVDGLPKHHELDIHGDLHKQPYEVRLRVLEYIGSLAGWQSTDEVPKTPGFNIVPSYWLKKPDPKELEKILKHIRDLPGSEGAMLKSVKSDYPLTGHTNLWLKYKKSADIHAVVIERLPTKTEGVYRYRVGLLLPSGWKAPKDEIKEITLKNGQKVKVLDVGKTFNTNKKLESGDIVTVMFHTLFVYDDGRVKVYEPKLYEVRPDQIIPDTVTDAIRIAEKAGILQRKESKQFTMGVRDMTDEELIMLHSMLHWQLWFGDSQQEDLEELHAEIADELEVRGYMHLSPLYDYYGNVPEMQDIQVGATDGVSHEDMTRNFAKYEIRQWAVNYLARQGRTVDVILELFGGYGYCTKWYRDVLGVKPKRHIVMEADSDKVAILKEKFGDSIEVMQGNNVHLLQQLSLEKVDILDVDPYNHAHEQLEVFLTSYKGSDPVVVVGTEGRLMMFIRNFRLNLRRHFYVEDAPDELVELRPYLPVFPRILHEYLSNLAAKHGWTFQLLAFNFLPSGHSCYWMGVLTCKKAMSSVLYVIPHCRASIDVQKFKTVYPWELYKSVWNNRIYAKLRHENLPFAVLSSTYGIWFWDERRPPVKEGDPTTERLLAKFKETVVRIKERGFSTVVFITTADVTHPFIKQMQQLLDEYGIKLIIRRPEELSRKARYAIQFHFRGGSVHADLRIEKPDGEALEGWTLAIQEENAFEKEVMKHWKVEKDGNLRKVYWDGELYYVYDMKKDEVLEWNRKLDKKILEWHKKAVFEHPEWWKIDLKTGRPKERPPGEGVDSKRPVVEKIWATKKQDEPEEWLEVEGVYPPREIEPVPGGTRFWPGIFVLVDKGTVEYGAQKSYFKEYFFHGKVLKGRYVVRLVNRNGKMQWLFWKTDDELPYVISKRAVQIGWMPPKGESALPEEWEQKVPKELRWWETDDPKEARRRRDEFAKMIWEKKLAKEPDWKSVKRWLLQYQWWRGPIIVRRGPTRQRYYMRLINNQGTIEIEMENDPREGKTPAIIRVVDYDEFWDVGKDDIVEVSPGTPYNQTKATPSYLITLDSGKAKVLEADPMVIKIDLGENRTFMMVRSSPDEDVWEAWIDYGSPEVK